MNNIITFENSRYDSLAEKFIRYHKSLWSDFIKEEFEEYMISCKINETSNDMDGNDYYIN